MAQKGQTRITDKRMITAVFTCSAAGEFLPLQLIYGEKTDHCHPIVLIGHNAQWSNQKNNGSKIILSFVEKVRSDLGLDEQQVALAIFDCFRGQLTEK